MIILIVSLALGIVPLTVFLIHRSTELSHLYKSAVKGADHYEDHVKRKFLDKPEKPKATGPYTPALLTPEDVQDDRTMIHIVKTRFMQYQANLTALGWGRFHLFKEFCMPSIVKQTTKNFLWLVYTDPDLDSDLLNAMIKLLEPYPNFYLIKSLSNAMWKGGQAQNMTSATVFTGNQTQLEAVMALRDVLPTLDTRLDADDAIHVGYMEEVQRQAIQFFTEESVEWMYWCVGQELEWNWVGPHGYTADQKQYGILESKPYEDFCPTPGLTLGYAAKTSVDSIYTRRHSVLVERLHTKNFDFCGKGREGKDCYQIVRKFEFPAFRCRTPTSASMVMTDYSKEKKLRELENSNLDPKWKALHESFGVPRSNIHLANDYMTEHIIEIAENALMGQCTKGHSCSVRLCPTCPNKTTTVVSPVCKLAFRFVTELTSLYFLSRPFLLYSYQLRKMQRKSSRRSLKGTQT